MKNDVGLPIRLAILHACIFCLLIFIDYGFVYIDAHFGADDLAENSFTEWAAEIQLMVMICLLIFMIRSNRDGRSFLSLLAGCMLIMLIREFNNFFADYIFEGSCTLLIVVAAVTTGYFFFKNRHEILRGATAFIRSPGFGWFTCGSAAVFIFSRLFGLPVLWHLILHDNYVRIAERFVEEGIELLGYSCMLIGVVEYASAFNKKVAGKHLDEKMRFVSMCASRAVTNLNLPEGQQDGLTAETRNHIPVSPNFAGKYSLSQQNPKDYQQQPAKFEQRK